MKKCIISVILLALLTGCGKVTDVNGSESRISIVSGTVEGTTTSETETTETDVTTDEATTGEKTTTTKTVGDKVSGTTAVTTKKSNVQPATRASGGSSGGNHGTTRQVPTAPRTTTTTSEQPTTQPPTFDPKDYSSISFALNDSANEIDVSRNGVSNSIQVLKDVDLTDIKNAISNDPSKTINDFIVRNNDFDFDGYPDLFIVEKPDDSNRTGKFYRYDPTKGIYTSWSELNGLGFDGGARGYEIMPNATENSLTIYDKKDPLNYEAKTFSWNGYKLLVLRKYVKQYNDGELIDTVLYDENGIETLRETRDSQGNLIGGENEEQPQGD